MSSLGVTGVRSKITTDVGTMVKLVCEVTDVPVAVGFRISTPEHAKKALETVMRQAEKMCINQMDFVLMERAAEGEDEY